MATLYYPRPSTFLSKIGFLSQNTPYPASSPTTKPSSAFENRYFASPDRRDCSLRRALIAISLFSSYWRPAAFIERPAKTFSLHATHPRLSPSPSDLTGK